MGNKQTLQEHNINLSSILSTIGSLPIKSDVEEQASVGLYVWKKLTAEGGDFIDFAVSDNESKYPDGGTQDGYWYEKVVEGITGVDSGEITVGNSTSITIQHSLGKTPSVVGLMCISTNSAERMSIVSYPKLTYSAEVSCWGVDCYGSTGTFYVDLNSSSITLSEFSSSQPNFNGTYRWFVA